MSLLAAKKVGNILTGDTFQLSNMAKKAKEKHSDVVNSTVGALYDDQHHFLEYKTVTNIIKKLPIESHYAYAPTSGGEPFNNYIKKWVFQKHQSVIENAFHHDVVATPGATGALYNTFVNYLDESDTVILPSIFWTNYLVMLGQIGAKHLTYPMFDGDAFNFDGFVEATKKVLLTKNKIVALFNDPAHNPTGYSMTPSEWERIYKYMNKLANSGVDVIIIYDLAYIDYEGASFKESRKSFIALKKIASDMLVIFAFSGSKSFSLYGLRVGAQIAISKSEAHIKDFKKASIYSARATWSCPPSTGIYLVNNLFSSDSLTKRFIKELNVSREMLKRRVDLFLQEAEEVGLPTYPYRGGFFITIPTKKPDQMFDLLAENKHLYTIPVDFGVRLAISSIPYDEIAGMAKKIKEVLI